MYGLEDLLKTWCQAQGRVPSLLVWLESRWKHFVRVIGKIYKMHVSMLFLTLYLDGTWIHWFKCSSSIKMSWSTFGGFSQNHMIWKIQLWMERSSFLFYRFWWEAEGMFTQQQKAELLKSSISQIICDNSDIREVPPDSFRYRKYPSDYLSCDHIPSMSLEAWREEKSQGGLRKLLGYFLQVKTHQ